MREFSLLLLLVFTFELWINYCISMFTIDESIADTRFFSNQESFIEENSTTRCTIGAASIFNLRRPLRVSIHRGEKQKFQWNSTTSRRKSIKLELKQSKWFTLVPRHTLRFVCIVSITRLSNFTSSWFRRMKRTPYGRKWSLEYVMSFASIYRPHP